MKKNHKNDNMFAALSTAASLGFIMVSCLGAGLFLGRAADAYFSTAPWGTVSGIVLGIISGMWVTYKRLTGET